MVSLSRKCKPPRFNDCSFFTKCDKQVSHIAVNFLDQNSRLKGKVLDLKTDPGEALGLERGSYAVKWDLLTLEMSAKRPPH